MKTPKEIANGLRGPWDIVTDGMLTRIAAAIAEEREQTTIARTGLGAAVDELVRLRADLAEARVALADSAAWLKAATDCVNNARALLDRLGTPPAEPRNRPVAFRWQTPSGCWVYNGDEAVAAEMSGGDYQGLYVREEDRDD